MSRIDSWHRKFSTCRHFQNGHHNTTKPRVSPLRFLNTSAVIRYLIFVYASHFSSEDRMTSIKHCARRISSKMATIDEFVLKNIGLWWRYGISRHCDEWKYIIIGRIFESEIILIPPSLKISESSSYGSYRNTEEVWWRYGISRSCDECHNTAQIQHCPISTKFHMWVDYDVPNRFLTTKNFYRSPFSKWPPQYRTNSTLFDFNVLNWFPTSKNFYRSPFSK
jgi:hypothetical protein